MYFKKALGLIFIVFCIGSCVANLYMPIAADADKHHIPLDSLKEGRIEYIKHCGGCHNLYLPNKYTTQQWAKIMDGMQKPAKINDSRKTIILRYLEVNSKK